MQSLCHDDYFLFFKQIIDTVAEDIVVNATRSSALLFQERNGSSTIEPIGIFLEVSSIRT